MTIKQMEKLANNIRQDIIKMLLAAGSGHSAGPLGMADVFTALYFGGVANLDPKKRKDLNRDRVGKVITNERIGLQMGDIDVGGGISNERC